MTDLVTQNLDDVAGASAAAAAAAAGSRVEIRELEAVPDLTAVEALLDRIWDAAPGRPQLAAEMLRAFAIAGSYVVGAYDADVLVGACVGFAEAPSRRSLHSHIAGVDPSVRGRDIGFALKVHQRAWAMQRGFDTIAWTFDPLVRRNAYFNLTKLGALPHQYFPNFYGSMTDGINRADASDRIYVHWELAAPDVRRRCGDPGASAVAASTGFDDAPAVLHADDQGNPLRTAAPDAARVVVGLPADIERVRRHDPAAGRRWRLALREALMSELDAHAGIVGFDRAKGYLIERGATA